VHILDAQGQSLAKVVSFWDGGVAVYLPEIERRCPALHLAK
jgi:hypothetical protein